MCAAMAYPRFYASLACLSVVFCCATIAQTPTPQQTPVQSDRAVRAKVTLENWDNGGAISTFVYQNATEVFSSAPVRRAGAVRELPVHLRPEIGDFVVDNDKGKDITLREFIARPGVDGFLILHKGTVVYEEYPRMSPSDQHLLFSTTKAFVGTVLGILETQGKINLEKPIEQYLPSLANSGWAGTSVRDIADMASGMEGVEDSMEAYTNPANKHYQMEASLGWQPLTPAMPESVRSYETYEFLASFKRLRKAGEAQLYTSANTEVLADLLEHVTGKPLPQLISEMLWSKTGADNDAYFLLNPKGYPIAHAGMGTTLRDLARFGLLFTPAGQSANSPAVPPAFIKALLDKPQRQLETGKMPTWFSHSSYQWDGVSKFGQIFKGGFAGQLLFIDCKRDVVIAYLGTNIDENWHPEPLPLVRLIETYF
jgi:CubicO group peptidase (beta-lactamase class C family)